MKILEYIKGNKKGKDAHKIERKALNDPFLADALDGFDSVSGEHARRIPEMQRRIHHKTASKNHIFYKAVVGIASVVLVFSYVVLSDRNSSFMEEEILYSMNEDTEGWTEDIYVYIPDEYVQKRKLEAIAEESSNKEIYTNSKIQANIVNISEIFLPEQAITIYIPEKYFERQNLKEDTYIYVGADI